MKKLPQLIDYICKICRMVPPTPVKGIIIDETLIMTSI